MFLEPHVYSNREDPNLTSYFNIGMEFEFYSDVDDLKLIDILTKKLNKEIVLSKKYHSNIPVTATSFKLEPDFSGGVKLKELITGPLPYDEARQVIIDVCEIIETYGSTTSTCSLHLNIGYNNHNASKFNITKINKLKFCLNIDEKLIYKYFPTRKNSVYAKSIKKIWSLNSYLTDYFNFINPQIRIPNDKYWGVNFTKLAKNYLEFRYIGGENWHKKINAILDLSAYFCKFIHQNVINREISLDEKQKINELVYKSNSAVHFLENVSNFKRTFKNTKISVDNDESDLNLQVKWGHIQKVLKPFYLYNTIQPDSKLHINFNSETGRLEIKGYKANFIGLNSLKNVDAFDCNITGLVDKCGLYNCDVKNANISDSVIERSKIEACKILETSIDKYSELTNCYVKNDADLLINCRFNSGVLRNGLIGNDCKLTKDVEIISFRRSN